MYISLFVSFDIDFLTLLCLNTIIMPTAAAQDYEARHSLPDDPYQGVLVVEAWDRDLHTDKDGRVWHATPDGWLQLPVGMPVSVYPTTEDGMPAAPHMRYVTGHSLELLRYDEHRKLPPSVERHIAEVRRGITSHTPKHTAERYTEEVQRLYRIIDIGDDEFVVHPPLPRPEQRPRTESTYTAIGRATVRQRQHAV